MADVREEISPESREETAVGTSDQPVDLAMSGEESSKDEEFILSDKKEDKEFKHKDYNDQFAKNYFENNPSGIHLIDKERNELN